MMLRFSWLFGWLTGCSLGWQSSPRVVALGGIPHFEPRWVTLDCHLVQSSVGNAVACNDFLCPCHIAVLGLDVRDGRTINDLADSHNYECWVEEVTAKVWCNVKEDINAVELKEDNGATAKVEEQRKDAEVEVGPKTCIGHARPYSRAALSYES
ncbi:uncharacterized protein FSUBG_13670 [Fusarium subglutinans]|uniref:Secreted protein n=1 Tax=Gibberella subglutinans TaxID=42677 RepID=A0A8H5KW19_GIBSU|nr:uncharacterized protein FSUBG_13670 [Fusarium subglutinans]KAF5579020.1 hypothetical protein FSUBG_13670 [Fusarium subglutinans]